MWSCGKCTFENDERRRHCDMCRERRGSHVTYRVISKVDDSTQGPRKRTTRAPLSEQEQPASKRMRTGSPARLPLQSVSRKERSVGDNKATAPSKSTDAQSSGDAQSEPARPARTKRSSKGHVPTETATLRKGTSEKVRRPSLQIRDKKLSSVRLSDVVHPSEEACTSAMQGDEEVSPASSPNTTRSAGGSPSLGPAVLNSFVNDEASKKSMPGPEPAVINRASNDDEASKNSVTYSEVTTRSRVGTFEVSNACDVPANVPTNNDAPEAESDTTGDDDATDNASAKKMNAPLNGVDGAGDRTEAATNSETADPGDNRACGRDECGSHENDVNAQSPLVDSFPTYPEMKSLFPEISEGPRGPRVAASLTSPLGNLQPVFPLSIVPALSPLGIIEDASPDAPPQLSVLDVDTAVTLLYELKNCVIRVRNSEFLLATNLGTSGFRWREAVRMHTEEAVSLSSLLYSMWPKLSWGNDAEGNRLLDALRCMLQYIFPLLMEEAPSRGLDLNSAELVWSQRLRCHLACWFVRCMTCAADKLPALGRLAKNSPASSDPRLLCWQEWNVKFIVESVIRHLVLLFLQRPESHTPIRYKGSEDAESLRECERESNPEYDAPALAVWVQLHKFSGDSGVSVLPILRALLENTGSLASFVNSYADGAPQSWEISDVKSKMWTLVQCLQLVFADHNHDGMWSLVDHLFKTECADMSSLSKSLFSVLGQPEQRWKADEQAVSLHRRLSPVLRSVRSFSKSLGPLPVDLGRSVVSLFLGDQEVSLLHAAFCVRNKQPCCDGIAPSVVSALGLSEATLKEPVSVTEDGKKPTRPLLPCLHNVSVCSSGY
eukprot:Rmarinus@m.10386